MGNQREIRQVSPARLGVAIPIRDGCANAISKILSQHRQAHFYTYIAEPNTDTIFPNMDGDHTAVGVSKVARFIIQSGGKMWCGYDAFCNHLSDVAQYLNDAHFFVGDEEEYIDEFRITSGTLILDRVHNGGWRPVDEYINERWPTRETQ